MTWKWLESTRALQREAFNLDPDRDVNDIPAQIARIKDNFIATIVELVELLNETKWKYWSHEAPWVRRQRVLEEAVDANHFIGNMLVAVGVTDEEYEEAYQRKQEENRERQRVNYVSAQAEENT